MRSSRQALAVACALAISTASSAREVDQFTDRLFQLEHLADATPVLDARVDAMLQQLVVRLDTVRPTSRAGRDKIVYDMFQGGSNEVLSQLRTPYEDWATHDADVERFHVDHRGVYGASVNFDDMGLGWYIDIAPVIRMGRRLIGVDKLGHFFGQGWFYYHRYQEIREAEPHVTAEEIDHRVLAYGRSLESTYLGLTGTGVYSFGDMAANWQGLRFYLVLFEGPAPYVTRSANGMYQVVRKFHFADYVTDSWDEVQNPSRPRTDGMYDKVAGYLRAHVCRDYRRDPARFMNATGVHQAATDYMDDADRVSARDCKRRFAIADICR
jgi:hypothetical protein